MSLTSRIGTTQLLFSRDFTQAAGSAPTMALLNKLINLGVLGQVLQGFSRLGTNNQLLPPIKIFGADRNGPLSLMGIAVPVMRHRLLGSCRQHYLNNSALLPPNQSSRLKEE
ncbi:MAG: hypothetical protein ACP5SH_14865 [Syntrophobacteraceae bacterium]